MTNSEIIMKTVNGMINLACLVVGLAFLLYSVGMTPEYAGERYDTQIIGFLLLILGGQK